MESRITLGGRGVGLAAVGFAAVTLLGRASLAATIEWRSHEWTVTDGGMAGVCPGRPDNVFVDADGFLHLRISNDGGTWTAAEIFSTDSMGFGTYQWQIDGAVDRYDPNVVVGLFPYGPAAGLGASGNNEIDIEYARWGNAAWDNGNFTVWPPPPTSGSESSTFDFDLGGGTATTSRFVWASGQIDFLSMSGFVPVASSEGRLGSWTYAPSDPTARIPQQAMPLGMNLWCFEATPTDGQEVEMIVRDFVFVPEGEPLPTGTGGAGGAGGSAGAETGGGAGTGDSAGAPAAGAGGSAGAAGGTAPSAGGATESGGTTTAGASPAAGGASPAAGGATEAGGAPAASGGTSTTSGGALTAAGGTAATGGIGGTGALPGVGGEPARPAVGGSAGDPSATGGGATAGESAAGTSGGTRVHGNEDDSGCSCRLPAGHGAGAAASWLALIAAGLGGLRRRARVPGRSASPGGRS